MRRPVVIISLVLLFVALISIAERWISVGFNGDPPGMATGVLSLILGSLVWALGSILWVISGFLEIGAIFLVPILLIVGLVVLVRAVLPHR